MIVSVNPRQLALLLSLLLGLCRSSVATERHANPGYEPDAPGPFSGATNLLLRAKVKDSSHYFFNLPELAVNGNHAVANEHWGADHLPAWLIAEMPEAKELNAIRLWTYWEDARAYQYLIEGSADAKKWQTLADHRENRDLSTAEGVTMFFPTTRVRYVRNKCQSSLLTQCS